MNKENKEIEVKILEIDPDEIEEKLEELGARMVFSGTLRNVFLDKNKVLEAKDSLIRLRDDGTKSILTYKRNITQGKVRKSVEIEVGVSNFSQMQRILNSLGFRERFEYSKARKHYVLGEMSFEIDTIPGIPPLLEIEGPSEKEVLEHVRLLGFSEKDAKNWTGKQLSEHYNKKHLPMQ